MTNEQLTIWPDNRKFDGCGWNRVQEQTRPFRVYTRGDEAWTPSMEAALQAYEDEKREKREKEAAETARKDKLLGMVVGLNVSDIEQAFQGLVDDSDIEISREDVGIGHYEYWGATGFESRVVETAEGSGEDELEWVQQDFPCLDGDELEATHTGFVVTSRQYSSRYDEYFEDGHNVTSTVKGTITSFSYSKATQEVEFEGKVERISFYRCYATVEWEVGE